MAKIRVLIADDHAVLRDLKRAWDPDNLLGLTHNIAPSVAATRSAWSWSLTMSRMRSTTDTSVS